jgi:hypothetical protein
MEQILRESMVSRYWRYVLYILLIPRVCHERSRSNFLAVHFASLLRTQIFRCDNIDATCNVCRLLGTIRTIRAAFHESLVDSLRGKEGRYARRSVWGFICLTCNGISSKEVNRRLSRGWRGEVIASSPFSERSLANGQLS